MAIEYIHSIVLLIVLLSACAMVASLIFFNSAFVKKYRVFEVLLVVFLSGIIISFILQNFIFQKPVIG